MQCWKPSATTLTTSNKQMSQEIAPPGMMLRLLEGRAAAEAGQLMLQLPVLRLLARRGRGEPVLVLPGFMADDTSTVMLRRFLNDIGYRARGWGLGVNRHRMLDFLAPVSELVADIARDNDHPALLVGWSRGGIIAREVARDRPEIVSKVITIGTPVKGGVSVSSIGNWVRRETGLTPQEMSRLLRERQKRRIRVPVRAIYSKLDGVVAWRACIDDMNPDVEHFEISGSHTGMGFSAEVFRLLPNLLKED